MNDQNLSYKILLIEDDKEAANYLKSSLEIRGHSTTVLNHGGQALNYIEKVKKDDFDVVLLDLNLPGATGWEILAKIRSLNDTSRLPIIMLTGVDDNTTEARALYDGADDYVIKPCSLKVLLARIESNLRKRQTTSLADIDLPFTNGDFDEISEREKEILSYMVKGYSNKDIAKMTFISEKTVMNHVRNILTKLKVENRMQASIVALKYGLI
ncbi:MAG: response regulator transcription factor [Cyanobacteriota bacterium]